jgi:hypothetical protein
VTGAGVPRQVTVARGEAKAGRLPAERPGPDSGADHWPWQAWTRTVTLALALATGRHGGRGRPGPAAHVELASSSSESSLISTT